MKLKEKEISKADLIKKTEAYKTLNSVLVSANAEFMLSLNNILAKKEEEFKQLEEKLKKEENATEDDNAKYLFLGGYVQCLKDILSAKR